MYEVNRIEIVKKLELLVNRTLTTKSNLVITLNSDLYVHETVSGYILT